MRKYLLKIPGMFYLLLALVILVVADGLVTRFLILNNIATERNPFLVGIVGTQAFLKIKVAGALLAAVILWDIYRRWPVLAKVATSLFVFIYAGIVTWNLYVLFL